MIDPKELRIGNYVYENDWVGQHMAQIDRIVPELTARGVEYPNNYEPIELTPEILEKAGFSDKEDYLQNEGGLKIWFDGVGYYHINSEIFVQFTYLHELQNFYFACTQEEIQINL